MCFSGLGLVPLKTAPHSSICETRVRCLISQTGERQKPRILVVHSGLQKWRFKVSFPNPWQRFQRNGSIGAITASIRIYWLFVIQVFTSGKDLPTENKIFRLSSVAIHFKDGNECNEMLMSQCNLDYPWELIWLAVFSVFFMDIYFVVIHHHWNGPHQMLRKRHDLTIHSHRPTHRQRLCHRKSFSMT